ncbi:MAG: response regulator [Planctomycetia bacterium]|nr:response regulator [Planctomycetia bacterium]
MDDKNNTLERLRAMAIKLLESGTNSVDLNMVGNDVKDLLQELNIYHIELEHQNKELERSEKENAVSRAEYVDLFENAPVGYVVIDSDYIIHKFNRTFIETFIPINKRNVIREGYRFDEFVCPKFQNVFYLFCNMIHKPGYSAPLEIKLFDHLQKPRYVMITAGKHQAEQDQFLLIVSDISRQKSLESQLVQSKEKAEESDRQKSLFLTSVSHELRTPLTTIIGFSELIDNESLSPNTRQEYLDSIKFSGKMLMSLTDEVLDLSLLESGSIPFRYNNINVAKMCEEVVAVAQNTIKSKNVLIRSEIDTMPTLWGDHMRLRQIVSAVLNHAVDNATEGTIVVRGGFIPSHNGNGHLIFLIFGRNIFSGESGLEVVDPHRMPVSFNCSGLGLYNARQIIKAMKGEMIWVHPLDSLRIEIPIKISLHADHSEEPEETPYVSDTPRTCLLVDDVVLNLKVLDAILRLMNFVPTLANSAKEALDLLGKKHYDIIISDLWMPDMNGEEFASIIRQNPAYNDIPIYAITADVEFKTNFDMTFFENTITKPINIEKIKKLFAAEKE